MADISRDDTGAESKGATLETPVDYAWRTYPNEGDYRVVAVEAIRARDAGTAAKCEQMAAEAQREVEAARATCRTLSGDAFIDEHGRALRNEGQASALRAVAAMLRGGR